MSGADYKNLYFLLVGKGIESNCNNLKNFEPCHNKKNVLKFLVDSDQTIAYNKIKTDFPQLQVQLNSNHRNICSQSFFLNQSAFLITC